MIIKTYLSIVYLMIVMFSKDFKCKIIRYNFLTHFLELSLPILSLWQVLVLVRKKKVDKQGKFFPLFYPALHFPRTRGQSFT